jgi:hypothetical protein
MLALSRPPWKRPKIVRNGEYSKIFWRAGALIGAPELSTESTILVGPTPAEEVEVEFLQPRIPGRLSWSAKTGKREPPDLGTPPQSS